jgi:hypothetical protein
MAETAAHLVDHVIPHVPVRQFVLSVPKRLRPFLHHRPRTAGAVLHILRRALGLETERRPSGGRTGATETRGAQGRRVAGAPRGSTPTLKGECNDDY